MRLQRRTRSEPRLRIERLQRKLRRRGVGSVITVTVRGLPLSGGLRRRCLRSAGVSAFGRVGRGRIRVVRHGRAASSGARRSRRGSRREGVSLGTRITPFVGVVRVGTTRTIVVGCIAVARRVGTRSTTRIVGCIAVARRVGTRSTTRTAVGTTTRIVGTVVGTRVGTRFTTRTVAVVGRVGIRSS